MTAWEFIEELTGSIINLNLNKIDFEILFVECKKKGKVENNKTRTRSTYIQYIILLYEERTKQNDQLPVPKHSVKSVCVDYCTR